MFVLADRGSMWQIKQENLKPPDRANPTDLVLKARHKKLFMYNYYLTLEKSVEEGNGGRSVSEAYCQVHWLGTDTVTDNAAKQI